MNGGSWYAADSPFGSCTLSTFGGVSGSGVTTIAYDATYGRQTSALSFIVNRPSVEHGFELERYEDRDRVIRYRMKHLREARGAFEHGNQPMRGADPASNGT